MSVATYVLADGSTFKGSAITSGTSASWSFNTNPTSLSGDGSRSVNLVVVDNKSATIRVDTYDSSLANNANFRPGASGSLVLRCKLRGAGDTTSTTLTVTFAEAVLISYDSTSPNDTNGGMTLVFTAYDSDDNNSLVAYS